MVELIGPSVCLQNTARFIHGQHCVVTAVQDHADDIGLCALGIDGAGCVQNLLHGPFQGGRPDIDIGTGNTPLPADIADRTAADNGIYPIPLAGVYRVIGAPLVHHLVEADVRMGELAQPRQDGLQLIPLEAKADLLGMEVLPAVQERFQNIGAVKGQMGDMLAGVLGADHAVGDAPGQDHVIAVQMIQDLRAAETVDHIDMDLIRLHVPDQAFRIAQLAGRRYEYDDVDHGNSLSTKAEQLSAIETRQTCYRRSA